jgi:hypothetical protein
MSRTRRGGGRGNTPPGAAAHKSNDLVVQSTQAVCSSYRAMYRRAHH